MSGPCRKYTVQCASPSGLHRLAYLEWGRRDQPRVLVCVHGLSRCARDFDVLAQALAPHYRVVCPDLPGRGDSDWLRNPSEYQLPTYLGDLVTLIARLNVESVHWLGTSLGGLIGMTLASLPDSPINKLVLNDVGPLLTASSLARIGAYLGQCPSLPTIEAAEAYVRDVYAPFGSHSDAQWRLLTEYVVRENPDGSLRLHYDPALALAFKAQPEPRDVELWGIYDAIRCPTLLLRGERSDLLTRDTAEQMSVRGPRAKVVEVPQVGHAPTLMAETQVALVKEFLLAHAS
ncbi:MAG TPA: alpha/beta hydrolase [Polyangiaceae bacterium]|nr:alpha/beta hydrolase [Polyangiaceae bacterium]